jgi:hypothetical protein
MSDDEPISARDMSAMAEEFGGRAGFWWPDKANDDEIVGLIVRRVSVDPAVLTFTGASGEVFRVMMRPEDLDWVLGNPQLED